MIGKPSPRGKKPDKQGQTGPRFGSPLAYVLLVLVAFLLLRTLFQDAGFQRVPYSRLVERIRSDGCAKVILSQDWVKCYAKPGTDTPARSELPWFAVRGAGGPRAPLRQLAHAPDERRHAGRSARGDELRKDQGAHLHGGADRRLLQGRRGHRRGGRRAEGDRRVPQDAEQVPPPRRPYPQGRAPCRT